jgi:hypothetical protein
MLCKISGFHGSDDEECCLLGCWPCGSCKNRRFGGKYRPHRQGDKNRRARNNVRSITSNQSTLRINTRSVLWLLVILLTLFLALRLSSYFHLEDWGDIPPNRRFLQESRGVTTQKTTFVNTVIVRVNNERTPNLAVWRHCIHYRSLCTLGLGITTYTKPRGP